MYIGYIWLVNLTNTKFQPIMAVKDAIEKVSLEPDNVIIGVIGAASSSVTKPLAKATLGLNLPLVSYASTHKGNLGSASQSEITNSIQLQTLPSTRCLPAQYGQIACWPRPFWRSWLLSISTPLKHLAQRGLTTAEHWRKI